MMVTGNSWRGILLLVLLSMISFWAGHKHDDKALSPVTSLDPGLNYKLKNFNLQVFDTNGQILLNMRGPLLRNNPSLKLGTIQHPVIALTQPNANWSLLADTATVTEDRQHIRLYGHVNVQRLEPASGYHIEMDTHEVKVEVAAQTANTDKSVRLFDGHNHMQAVGMDLDMKNGRIKFKHKVKATYAVN